MVEEFRCPACGAAVPADADLEFDTCAECGASFADAFAAAQVAAEARLTKRERSVLERLEKRGWTGPLSADEKVVETRFHSLLRRAFNTQGQSRWEYCRLEAPGLAQGVSVTWMGPGGYATRLGVDTEGWLHEATPWDYSIGALGEAGWEMVSIQHDFQPAAQHDNPSTIDLLFADDRSAAVWGRAIAVFKRPKLAGRSIDDAGLTG